MNTERIATPLETTHRNGRHNGHGNYEPAPVNAGRPPVEISPAPESPGKGFAIGVKGKIIIPAVAALLISLGAIYIAVLREAKVLETSRMTALASSARSVQDKIDRCFFERYGDVQAFALNRTFHRDLKTLTDADRMGIVSLLDDYAKSYGCYDLSLVTDPAGKIIAVNTQSPQGDPLPNAHLLIGGSVADTEGYRNAVDGKFTTYKDPAALTGTFVSAPEKNPLITQVYGDKAPNWTVTLTAPIRDSQTGDIRGYWQNYFDCDMIEKIVLAEYAEQKKQGLPSTEIQVVDPAGQLIVDADPSETGKSEVRTTDLFKDNFLDSGEDIALAAKKSADADGTVYGKNARMSKQAGHAFVQPGGFARSTPILGYAGTGFTTFVRAESKELFTVTNTLKLVTQITAIVGLSLGAVLLWLVARSIVGGINNVKTAIVGLAHGDISRDIPAQTNDEVGAMSRSFNQARRDLRKAFGQDQIDWIAVAELKVRNDIVSVMSIISESDLKGNILNINEKFTEVSQYNREELIGKPHSVVRHPDMPKETFKELWATIGRGKTFRGVIKNRKKDGTPYYVDAVIAPVLDDNGKPIKYIGIRYDITAMELERQNMRGILSAIDSSYAYVEFNTKGEIIAANPIFLKTLGYQLNEIAGKHHRTFVEPAYANSVAYAQFWSDLNSGMAKSDVFKRLTKDGREIWIQAVFAPVKDEMGRVTKIIKIATDVTEPKVTGMNSQRQIEEINRTQAVIEFTSEGVCLTANDNLCNIMGYRLEEIKGRHHSLFVDAAFRDSADYKQLWRDLNDGKFQTAEYKRVGKNGKDVWLQATYNPMFDINGRVNRVVKFATDITGRKVAESNLKATIKVVSDNAQALSSASEELTAVSQQMSSNTEETATQANVVAAAAEQVSRNVATVAASAEEMSASVKEIAQNAGEAARVASEAVGVARDTNATITKLGDSSIEIGKVVKVITSIAEQTNLLALNATIEAARAGEAGKGFAVVANEVKELAKQTATATEDISRKINVIQGDTTSAIAAIKQIGSVIGRINDISNTIASAVEEQSATTNEIARNASEAAKGSMEISKNIASVSTVAQNTTEGANNTLSAATELAKLAGELKAVVDQVKS